MVICGGVFLISIINSFKALGLSVNARCLNFLIMSRKAMSTEVYRLLLNQTLYEFEGNFFKDTDLGGRNGRGLE